MLSLRRYWSWRREYLSNSCLIVPWLLDVSITSKEPACPAKAVHKVERPSSPSRQPANFKDLNETVSRIKAFAIDISQYNTNLRASMGTRTKLFNIIHGHRVPGHVDGMTSLKLSSRKQRDWAQHLGAGFAEFRVVGLSTALLISPSLDAQNVCKINAADRFRCECQRVKFLCENRCPSQMLVVLFGNFVA